MFTEMLEVSVFISNLLVLLFCLLSELRKYIFQYETKDKQGITTKNFPQLAELNAQEKTFIYLGLVSSTFLFMFSLVPFSGLSLWDIVIAISAVLVGSFLLILSLQAVLRTMRQNKQLSVLFLFNPYVLGMAGLVIALEFIFLNWSKGVTIYFQLPFQWFVILYSLLILIIAIYLDLRTDDKRFLKNGAFLLLTVLDSIIVVLLANIFLQITLAIIFLLN